MDFLNAALLIAVVYAIVEWADTVWPGEMPSKAKPVVALVASFVATFLVAETVWATDQVVGGHTLEDLAVADLVVVAVLLAAAASALKEGLRAVTNIGENQPPGG